MWNTLWPSHATTCWVIVCECAPGQVPALGLIKCGGSERDMPPCSLCGKFKHAFTKPSVWACGECDICYIGKLFSTLPHVSFFLDLPVCTHLIDKTLYLICMLLMPLLLTCHFFLGVLPKGHSICKPHFKNKAVLSLCAVSLHDCHWTYRGTV